MVEIKIIFTSKVIFGKSDGKGQLVSVYVGCRWNTQALEIQTKKAATAKLNPNQNGK